MSVESIGTGIKTNLGNVTGLNKIFATNEIPDSINSFPAAIIQHTGTTYGITMGGDNSHDTHTFKIKIAVTKQDSPSAFNKLLDFLTKTGDNSIVQKLNADPTLNGSASDITVISNSGQGGFEWAGVLYLGTEFDIEVYE